jgi:hypothetical protein
LIDPATGRPHPLLGCPIAQVSASFSKPNQRASPIMA